MPIVVVGLNHVTAPISLLERVAISAEELPKGLQQLTNYEHVVEGAILSTCNRIEIYAHVTKFHGGAQDLRNFLGEFRYVAPEELVDHVYTYHDEGAIGHLFRVAAGIDSMVIGESEILGQVRRAFQAAEEEGTARRLLSAAFRSALRVGKRARTETAIARNPASISSAAVDLAKRAFGSNDLKNKRVVIVGAGKMGRLAARALAASGVSDVTVVNRSEERARELADAFGVEPLPLDRLAAALADADILICSTTAATAVIDVKMLEDAVARRDHDLFIVDIAVPRDVDPRAKDLPGVLLRDIDDLRGVVENSVGSRLGEVSKVEAIVAEELQRFLEWERATEIAPTVSALIERSEDVRRAEVERVHGRLAHLSDSDRDAIDQVTKRVVAKLLHEPLNKAKELASSKQGHLYLAALRELFELDDQPDP